MASFFWGAQSFPSWKNTIKHCRLFRVDVRMMHECKMELWLHDIERGFFTVFGFEEQELCFFPQEFGLILSTSADCNASTHSWPWICWTSGWAQKKQEGPRACARDVIDMFHISQEVWSDLMAISLSLCAMVAKLHYTSLYPYDCMVIRPLGICTPMRFGFPLWEWFQLDA